MSKSLKLLQALNDNKKSTIDDCLKDKPLKQWINNRVRIKAITQLRTTFPAYLEHSTCLCYAARTNEARIVQKLVQSGADVTVTDSCGWTPLHWACITSIDGKRKVSYLLQCDPSAVRARDASGDMPLHKAALHGRTDVISILIQHGADIHDKGLFGRTPLHCASNKGNVACIKELVKLGANLESTDSERGQTPLMLAADFNHNASVETLINKFGASINAIDIHGRTALLLAAACGYLDIVKTLTANPKCDHNKADNNGRTALDHAKRKGHSAVVEWLEYLALPVETGGANLTQEQASVTGGEASGTEVQAPSVTPAMPKEKNITDGDKVFGNF